MKLKITVKHIRHTKTMDNRIKNKSRKLNKFIGEKTDLQWTIYKSEGQYHADVKLLGPTFSFQASTATNNLYKTLDKAVTKLIKQIGKKKEIWKDKLHHRKRRLRILDPEQAWTGYDEDNFDDIKLNYGS